MGFIEIIWTATGIVVPLLLGTAWAMVGLNPPEFWIARGCIGFAALIFGATTLTWLAMSEWPPPARIAVGAGLGIIAFIGFSEALRWVNARESLLTAQAEAIGDKRVETREQLHKFYVESETLLNTVIPKDISSEDFQIYSDNVNNWATSAANWIGENLGAAARAKFLDRSSVPYLSYGRQVNDQHNAIINALVAFGKNLSTLIETSAWDKQEKS